MSDYYEQHIARVRAQAEADHREQVKLSKQYGYRVEDAAPSAQAQGIRFEVMAPCGCYACNDGVRQGHFACETPPAALLQAEAQGLVTRSYDDGAWRWYVTAR